MLSKDKVISVIEKLSIELNRYHKNSEIARFVSQELETLKKSNGIAFPNKLQYFFNNAPVIKLSDSISFNEAEKEVWNCVFEYKQLGNYNWIASE
ncbi:MULTISPECIES: hypothetical protein [Lacticaseibacillus]|uniref:hypothetical protein n=1 Tax=Lacticaseibacillus TaxID=2759736 RepID=UPI00063DC620|nr:MULTISPECIES: hypothetical protein [Lacticaseibacillus]KLI77037.1 hypothetical protein AAW28_00855 [Lacticaseibacillus casei]